MARTKKEATAPPTIAERIDFLYDLGKGRCPYGMIVYSNEDFEEAQRILKANRKYQKLISVRLMEK